MPQRVCAGRIIFIITLDEREQVRVGHEGAAVGLGGEVVAQLGGVEALWFVVVWLLLCVFALFEKSACVCVLCDVCIVGSLFPCNCVHKHRRLTSSRHCTPAASTPPLPLPPPLVWKPRQPPL